MSIHMGFVDNKWKDLAKGADKICSKLMGKQLRGNSSMEGVGTLEIDEAKNQYELKIRSLLIRGKFQADFQKEVLDNAELLTLDPIVDAKGNYKLTEGNIAFADVNGADCVEGLLYFSERRGKEFALFIKGVYRERSITNDSRSLVACFTFSDSDVGIPR